MSSEVYLSITDVNDIMAQKLNLLFTGFSHTPWTFIKLLTVHYKYMYLKGGGQKPLGLRNEPCSEISR